LPCLKEPNKTVFDVWFDVFVIIPSKSMVFFVHQNKDWPAPSPLFRCMADSSFDLDLIMFHCSLWLFQD
jgi:hypothetical protein